MSAVAGCATANPTAAPPNTVNDITQLNPIRVAGIATPQSIEELAGLVRDHGGPISIGGGRFSQGGQTACDGALFIDMRGMNRILRIEEAAPSITVQAGVTWRQIQEAVDPLGLSPTIMQSFSNFTVGGSLSVNCHGDYVGAGPIVESVLMLRIVMADGGVRTASLTQNPDLFAAAIGGYGGVGIIAEATLTLARNTRLERVTHHMRTDDYVAWHRQHVLDRDSVVLHHAVIYPGAYTHVAAETSSLTDKQVTVPHRLAPLGRPGPLSRAMLALVTFAPFGRSLHERLYDPMTADRQAVVWRNYEAARDVYSLEPASRTRHTYALQEYFVPVDRFDAFVAAMARVLNEHHANVLNVSVRHTRADRETLLAWAKTEVYSFVLYYEQATSETAKAAVGVWTRALVDAALAEGGSFYLPYQIHATRGQFLVAYPRADEYFALKRRLDPTYKFRNRLWEAYFPADGRPNGGADR
jgi:FAD/FMN-containing dehydrogenase